MLQSQISHLGGLLQMNSGTGTMVHEQVHRYLITTCTGNGC